MCYKRKEYGALGVVPCKRTFCLIRMRASNKSWLRARRSRKRRAETDRELHESKVTVGETTDLPVCVLMGQEFSVVGDTDLTQFSAREMKDKREETRESATDLGLRRPEDNQCRALICLNLENQWRRSRDVVSTYVPRFYREVEFKRRAEGVKAGSSYNPYRCDICNRSWKTVTERVYYHQLYPHVVTQEPPVPAQNGTNKRAQKSRNTK